MKQTKKMTQWSIISITLEWEWRKNEENICLMFEPGRWIGNPQKQMLIPTVKSIIWNAAFSGDITVISVWVAALYTFTLSFVVMCAEILYDNLLGVTLTDWIQSWMGQLKAGVQKTLSLRDTQVVYDFMDFPIMRVSLDYTAGRLHTFPITWVIADNLWAYYRNDRSINLRLHGLILSNSIPGDKISPSND